MMLTDCSFHKNHPLLVVETAFSKGFVGLFYGDNPLFFQEWDTRPASQRLIPAVEELIRQGGIAFQDLRGIVINVGPGRFTGLRMALGLAKALGYALNIPIYSVSSFDLLFARIELMGRKTSYRAVAFDAHGGKVFFAEEGGEGGVITDCELRKHLVELESGLVFGPGIETLYSRLGLGVPKGLEFFDVSIVPESYRMVLFAEKCKKNDWKSIKPLYLTASSAEEKLRQSK